jgi:hypothetical protein
MKYVAPYGSADQNAGYVNVIPGVQKGSPVDCKAIEHPLREIVKVIMEGGLEPSGADLTQLHQAIVNIIGIKVPLATTEVAGLVKPDGVTCAVDEDGVLSAASSYEKTWIGVPRNWRSTVLPPNHCWANGDFIAFADWPDIEEVYLADGFAGMVLPWDANNDAIAANLGQWRPDAPNPTGLYTPNLGDQFLRAWVAGLARAAGSWQNDAMRNHMHNVNYRGTHSTAGNYIVMGANTGAQPQTQNMGGPVDFAGNNLLTADHNRPPNISQPMIIYLGIPA